MIANRPLRKPAMNSAPAIKPELGQQDLIVLQALRDKGPMTAVQIGSHLSSMPGSIVLSLRRLTPHGYIRHSRAGSRMLATITEAGRKYASRSISTSH